MERDKTYHDLKGLLAVAIFGHPSGSNRPADTGCATRSRAQSSSRRDVGGIPQATTAARGRCSQLSLSPTVCTSAAKTIAVWLERLPTLSTHE